MSEHEEEFEEEELEEENNYFDFENIPPDQWDLPIGFDTLGFPITLRKYKEKAKINKFRGLNFLDTNKKKLKELALLRLSNVKDYGEMIISGDEVVNKERAIREIENETKLGGYLIELEKETIRIMMDDVDNEEGSTNEKTTRQ